MIAAMGLYPTWPCYVAAAVIVVACWLLFRRLR